ncbi:MAG: protein translocase subunit SecF, partial [Gammaproteobacteria bacterium]|nr:protein translocase subunit SecF [Gammaproteobacteria bacterium]
KNKSYLISSILLLLTIVIIFFKGLNLGIDFKGGLNFEIKTDLSKEQLSEIFDDFDSSKEILIKKELGSDVYTIRIESGEDNASLIEEINLILKGNSNLEILLSEYIEPTFSDELIKNSIYALASSLSVIAFYVWIRFDWQFAVSGIFALLHDVFLAIGFMSLFNIEFNLTMIAALLLIAGYSINDTIVLFDRLRSITNDEKNKDPFNVNVNNSIKLNLRRTILTSLTTIIALLCLVVLAPVNLTEMPIVFIFGVLIGTYSSIFLALGIVGDLNYEAVLKARDS